MDISKTIATMKRDPAFAENVGMVLIHNGTVRGWSRGDHSPVSQIEVMADEAKIEQICQEIEQREGIFKVVAEAHSGRMKPGDQELVRKDVGEQARRESELCLSLDARQRLLQTFGMAKLFGREPPQKIGAAQPTAVDGIRRLRFVQPVKTIRRNVDRRQARKTFVSPQLIRTHESVAKRPRPPGDVLSVDLLLAKVRSKKHACAQARESLQGVAAVFAEMRIRDRRDLHAVSREGGRD